MATRPAPLNAKDPVALAKLRREKAFSSPAPKVKVKAKPMSYNRFGSNRIPDRELDTPTRVFGEVVKAVLPDPATLKRAAMDPTGTAKGAVEVASLASPIANAYRGYKFLSGDGVSVTGAGMSDVEQALEVAGLYPSGKAVSAPFKAAVKAAPKIARVAGDVALSPAGMALGSSGLGGGNIARMARAAREVKAVEDVPVNRVIEARATTGFNPARATPEVVGMTRFGGAETSKLPWEEAQNRAGSAADYTPESIIQNESDLLNSFGYMGDNTPDRAVFARELSKQELVKKTKDALSSIKTRERQVNKKRIADGKDPFNYEPHFNPSKLSQEELVTLWGNNPLYVYDKAGNIIPNLGAALGHGTPLSGGGSATLGNVGGQRTIGNVRWGAS